MSFSEQPSDSSPIGVRAGHWSDFEARTGCTVILFDRSAPAVVDVRGGAPGTRETTLLRAGDLVQSVDAILLTGGSAFGLAAADGVMSYLNALGRGVPTAGGPVPIVPAAVLFDLAVGTRTWPTAESGRAACEAAVPLANLERGQVGAGTGATTSKILPNKPPSRGGLGLGHCDIPHTATVHAVVAVNALGCVSVAEDSEDLRPAILESMVVQPDARSATTLAVVVIDAPVDHRAMTRCAVAAHDAFARKIRPCHTIFDGDVVFVVGLQNGNPDVRRTLAYSVAVELAVERGIVDAITA